VAKLTDRVLETLPIFNICVDVMHHQARWRKTQEAFKTFWLQPRCTHLKVKWSHYRPSVAHRVGRGIALLFHDCDTRRGWVVSSTPRPHFTPGKTRYSFNRRLGGPQGRSGRVENLIPTGIRSWTIQPIVNCYTDWATWPMQSITLIIFHRNFTKHKPTQ